MGLSRAVSSVDAVVGSEAAGCRPSDSAERWGSEAVVGGEERGALSVGAAGLSGVSDQGAGAVRESNSSQDAHLRISIQLGSQRLKQGERVWIVV